MKMILAVIISINLLTISCLADEISDILPFLIQAESNGNPNAVSKAGAVGLCQITPIVWKELCQERDRINSESPDCGWFPPFTDWSDAWVPNKNVWLCSWYLRRLRDHYLKDVISDAKNGIWKDCEQNTGVFPTEIIGKMLWYCPNSKKAKSSLAYRGHRFKDFPNINSKEDVVLALILAGYNMGSTALKRIKYDINKASEETRNYVRKIMKLYRKDNQ